MQIPEKIKKCVAFLGYYNHKEKGFSLAGTVFFIAREIQGTGRWFHYAVTAKHVLDKLKGLGVDKLYMRYNLSGADAQWEEISLDNWFFHPNTDEAVDAAVLKLTLNEKIVDHLVLPTTLVATNQVIQDQQIGIGDEVFLTGLFINHFGKKRNIPILRVGNIAAMPEEPVESEFGLIEAYLVEARSIGGLSGSPVFVNLGASRSIGGSINLGGGGFYLLGLMQGHWGLPLSELDIATDDSAASKNRVNMGIGIVVPISKVMEIIEQQAIAVIENPVIERILLENPKAGQNTKPNG